jgi:hypothetical protein
MKQQSVPTKKDWRDAKEGFDPGVLALRAFTPPWVAKAMPAIITRIPPVR